MSEPLKMQRVPAGSAVLVDELGSVALETLPAAERGVLLELGGRVNRSEERWSGKFLMSWQQAMELCSDVLTSSFRAAGPDSGASREFRASLAAALLSDDPPAGGGAGG
jgi:hypothetical protein